MSWVRRLWPFNQAPMTTPELAEVIRGHGATSRWARVFVNYESAMGYPPFGGAVRVVSEVLSQLPLHLYRRDEHDDRKREVASDMHLDRLLHIRPNRYQSAIDFRQQLTNFAAATGTGYALISRVRGEIEELLPLLPGQVRAYTDAAFNVRYEILRNGAWQPLPADRVFRLQGPSDNGVTGVNLIERYRESIALGIAQERHAATMFGNGAKPSGGVKVPKKLSDTSYERLKKQLREDWGGENSNDTMIFEEGGEWVTISFNAEDSQLLESRKFQRSLITSILRVPLHLVNDLDRATWSNIEMMARVGVDYTFMPWAVRWEQAIYNQLLTDRQREQFYAKHNFDSLVRGDIKTRYEVYERGIRNKIINPNEAREKEDKNPYEGGDEFAAAANLYGSQEKDNADAVKSEPSA